MWPITKKNTFNVLYMCQQKLNLWDVWMKHLTQVYNIKENNKIRKTPKYKHLYALQQIQNESDFLQVIIKFQTTNVKNNY